MGTRLSILSLLRLEINPLFQSKDQILKKSNIIQTNLAQIYTFPTLAVTKYEYKPIVIQIPGQRPPNAMAQKR